MGFFLEQVLRKKVEDKNKADELRGDAPSSCSSSDVWDFASFQLPDRQSTCASVILDVLYKNQQTPEESPSFVQVFHAMSEHLEAADGCIQNPKLTASVDVNGQFDLVPPEVTGTKRALLIGINYAGQQQGELSGCHEDVQNMMEYIKNARGFEDANVRVLMDDGEHEEPTLVNILRAYGDIVEAAEPGDALFCHFSGGGDRIHCDRDDRDDYMGEDGNDQTLLPVDYPEAGEICCDDLHEILIRPLPEDVHLTCLMDCRPPGTVLNEGSSNNMSVSDLYRHSRRLTRTSNNMSVSDLYCHSRRLASTESMGTIEPLESGDIAAMSLTAMESSRFSYLFASRPRVASRRWKST